MMTWPYIAGFFDGEGCFLTRRGIPSGVQLTQAGDIGLVALRKIQAFLHLNGIASDIHYIQRAAKFKMHHTLRVGSAAGGCKFLSNVLPWLLVRKVAAQDIIRYMRLFPRLRLQGKTLRIWRPAPSQTCETPLNASESRWAYIAGFFDAEGHMSYTRSGTNRWPCRVELGQAGADGHAALEALSGFLAVHDIKNCVVRCGLWRRSKQEFSRLYVWSRRAASSFFLGVLPFSLIKKTALQDTLRFLTLFPDPRST